MTNPKHTKEPWGYIRTINGHHALVSDSGYVADFDNPEDAHRAYACVNALAGIDDPKVFMRDARVAAKTGSDKLMAMYMKDVRLHLKGGDA